MEFEIFVYNEDVVNSYQHIKEEIEKKKYVDTKFLYLHTQTVENWSKNEESSEGTLYSSISNASKESFKELIETEEFNNNIKNISVVVDLGIGKGVKSGLLLNRLKEMNFCLKEFYCFDFSLAMISKSMKYIKEKIKDLNINNITIKGYKGDFMRINETHLNASNRKNNKNILFMLLGGTIGNVNEEKFLSNLSKSMKQGDLGIITFFLIDENENIDEKEIEKKYIDVVYRVYIYTLEDMGYNLTDINVSMQNEEEKYLDVIVKVGLEDLTTGKYIDSVEIIHSKRFYTSYIEDLLKREGFQILKQSKDKNSLTASVLFKKISEVK